jgi:RNA polymerase sigma-70 factor (ECF subfamily)
VALAFLANRMNVRLVAARRAAPAAIMDAGRLGGAGNKSTAGAVYISMRSVQTPATLTADAARSQHFERHVLPHLDAAWRLARWLARAEHDAEDVLQEAMLRAYRYYDIGGRENVRAWLLTIVRNTFYTQCTQAPAASLMDEFDEAIHGADDDAATPESQLLREADAEQLRRAIERLPVEFREVLVLRELEGCSYREIVDISGLKMGTVMSRLSRARERLAHMLCAGAEPHAGGSHHAMQ